MKVAFKEIRESGVNLRIKIEKPGDCAVTIQIAFKETKELMVIFLKSIEMAKENKIASTF